MKLEENKFKEQIFFSSKNDFKKKKQVLTW
jgi:hypothetical protein